ncbi:hypothetical protein SAMN03159453_05674 [Pseudomonas sp. NFIX28]|nr:hypothetical protein SAMN03159453_05674 [Pseudomonas sp. NFIX28]
MQHPRQAVKGCGFGCHGFLWPRVQLTIAVFVAAAEGCDKVRRTFSDGPNAAAVPADRSLRQRLQGRVGRWCGIVRAVSAVGAGASRRRRPLVQERVCDVGHWSKDGRCGSLMQEWVVGAAFPPGGEGLRVRLPRVQLTMAVSVAAAEGCDKVRRTFSDGPNATAVPADRSLRQRLQGRVGHWCGIVRAVSAIGAGACVRRRPFMQERADAQYFGAGGDAGGGRCGPTFVGNRGVAKWPAAPVGLVAGFARSFRPSAPIL